MFWFYVCIYNMYNIDNNAKSVYLAKYRQCLKKKKKKKKRNLEAYCIVFDLIGSFTKLESATESAIKTNTEWAKQFWKTNYIQK